MTGLLPADGTAALDSLAGQAVGWGLAVAVAMVVICAAGWAVGSLASHPQVAARAKAGIVVALAGALLLGAGTGYLAWLSAGQAAAFTADPASYKAETAAPLPGIEVVNKTSDWMVAVNHYRRSTPADPVASDTTQSSRYTRTMDRPSRFASTRPGTINGGYLPAPGGPGKPISPLSPGR